MKGRYLSVILTLCMICTICLSPLSAWAEQTTVIFTGTVVNASGKGLSGVTVQASSHSTKTDSNGAWTLALPAGSHTFTFSKTGYAFSSISASSNGNTEVACGTVTGSSTATKAPAATPMPTEAPAATPKPTDSPTAVPATEAPAATPKPTDSPTAVPATEAPAVPEAAEPTETEAPAVIAQPAVQAGIAALTVAVDEPQATNTPVVNIEATVTDAPVVENNTQSPNVTMPESDASTSDTPQNAGNTITGPEADTSENASGVPAITNPGAYVATSAFTIAWTSVDSAEGYLLTLEDINHNQTVLNAARAEGTSYAIAAGMLTSGQRYTVSVSAVVDGMAGTPAKLTFAYLPEDEEVTDEGQSTDESTIVSIMPMAAPVNPLLEQLGTPTVSVSDASKLPITVSWAAVANASYYQISLYDTTAGKAVFEDKTTTGNTYLIYNTLTKDHSYVVEVYACPNVGDTKYTASGAGEARFDYSGSDASQTVSAPSIISPTSAYIAVDSDVTFTWTPVTGAEEYTWNLTRDGAIVNSGTLSAATPSMGPIKLTDLGQYVFAVSAKLTDGTYTEYSTASFTVVNSTAAYVTSYSMSPNKWQIEAGETVIWVLSGSNVEGNKVRLIIDNVVIDTKSIDSANMAIFSHTFDVAGTYQVQFQASADAGNTWGPLTDPKTMTVVSASTELGTPEITDVIRQTDGVTVRWSQAALAESYTLKIEGLTNTISQTYTTGTVTSQQVTLTEPGRYKATVTASAQSFTDTQSKAVEFEIVAGVSASWTGYIQADSTPAYANSTGGTAAATLSLNTEVIVLGQSGGYYYVQTGSNYYFVEKTKINSIKAAVVTSFTVPATATAGESVAIRDIKVDNSNGKVQLVLNGTLSDIFDASAGLSKTLAAGKYEIQLRAQNSNGDWGPYSIVKTVDVATVQTKPYLRNIGVQYVRQDFTVRWSTVPDVSFYELVLKNANGDTVTIYPTETTRNNYFTIYGRTITQIGRYSLTVVAHLKSGDTVSSDPMSFDVVQEGYRTWIGIVVPKSAEIYASPNTWDTIGTLYRNQKVTVVGELGRFYLIHNNSRTCYVLKSAIAWWANTDCYGKHVWGDTVVSKTHPHTSGTQTCKYCSATRTVWLQASKLKGCKTCYPSSGTSTSSKYTIPNYVDALGSASQRRSVYQYVTNLYAGMDGEASMDMIELLSVCFAPLPSQMQASTYSTANSNVAWDVASAYLTLLVDVALTDEVAASENALQLVAASVSNMLEGLLTRDVELDNGIRTALLAISAQCVNIAGSSADGTYSSSSLVQTAIAAILDGMPYDEELVAKVEKVLEGTGSEPLQERALRVAYALADQANDTLAGLTSTLSSSSSYSDVDTAHTAYLEYLLLVSRLNQTAETIGNAASSTVSSNWSTETTRRNTVFSIHDSLF